MKRVIYLALTLAVVFAVLIPVTRVIAQTESSTDLTTVSRRILTIKAPEKVQVGQPVPILVSDRNSGSPVLRAGVWAVDIKDITVETANAEVYAEPAEKCGFFLGWTNDNGYVWPHPSFRESGRYVLVAVKDGYLPGFAKISVVSIKALAIKAPEEVRVGQTVPILVSDRNSGSPVPRAGVWAIDTKNIAAERANAEVYTELAEKCGFFLGWTNADGYVLPHPHFGESGRYVLVAVKDGYLPGFAKISVVSNKALAIKAPEEVRVGQPVPILVFDRNLGSPVPRVGVWAIDTTNITAETSNAEVYAELAEKCGFFLGWTNTDGYVWPHPHFGESGRYVLVAMKNGYLPGFARITSLGPKISKVDVLDSVKAKQSISARQGVKLVNVQRLTVMTLKPILVKPEVLVQ
jgi:hypothetical protein